MLKFMKSGLRQIIALMPAILFAIIMPAQGLPKMPADPSVVSGVLPNGMSYYIAPNHSYKGMADFALVQKTGRKNVTEDPHRVAEVAGEAAASLPRLGSLSPLRFFSRHGSYPGQEGYVSVKDDATVFRFRNVCLSDGKAVLDSSLLVIMDIADRASFSGDPFLKKWYSPEDQTVIVAGDVDLKTVVSRLEAMSLMTPALPSAERIAPVAEPVSGTDVMVGMDGRTSTVTLRWLSGRVPREYMNTVQPVIFDMSLDILGKLAVKKIKAELRSQGIAYAGVTYKHIGSDEIPYDDVFSVSATVESGYAEKVAGIMAGVMEETDAEGVPADEYLWAEAAFTGELKQLADSPAVENSVLADRCISACLYNSSLAMPEQVYAFHESRSLPDTMRCRLFNDVAAALLYPQETPGTASSSGSFAAAFADTSSFSAAVSKVKIKSSKKDHISGGTIWTFSNGVKVIYRNMPSDGDVYYTLALNGGYAGIPDLAEGEGAFMSDILSLSEIAGMQGDVFKAFLQRYGITMDLRVTMSNTLMEGRLPKDEMSLLMKSLLAVANQRELSEDAYPYYRQCVNLELGSGMDQLYSRRTAIDSIMCPDFRYSPYRSEGRLTDSFCTKADKFLSGQMARMNDGVFIIVGDIGEEKLKKILLEYVGGFRTGETTVRRPVMRYQPVSGWSTYTVPGEINAVDVAVSARMPLTASNCFAADLAAMILERDLAAALADSGMAFELYCDFRIYPEERLDIMISVIETDSQGLVPGMSPVSPMTVLDNVRSVLSDMHSKDIDDAAFGSLKASLKNLISLRMKDPEYWLNAITARHLDGKDITTGYAGNIDALDKEDVRRVFSFLEKGCKVEYVTIRNL